MKTQTGFFYLCVICILGTLLIAGCKNEGASTTEDDQLPSLNVDMDALGWIEGKWAVGGGPSNQEIWKRISDTLYQANVIAMNETDTFQLEDIRLSKKTNGDIYFAPLVLNQNEGERVFFKLTSENPDSLIFENPAHDFPQRIIYKKIGDKFCKASIEGDQNGEFKRIIFPMERMEDE